MATRDTKTTALSLSVLEWGAVLLATITGLIHLALGIGAAPDPLGIAAIFAAAGFSAGIFLYVKNYRRTLVVTLGIPFVAGQIVLWYVLNRPASLGDISVLAAVDKPVQAILIVTLFILYRKEPRRLAPTGQ